MVTIKVTDKQNLYFWMLPREGGGGTPIYLDMGCAIFLGYFFSWKINCWVHLVASNKFLGQVFSLE